MMRFIYILLLSIFFAIGGYAQVMQTTGGAGGNKFRALKADSFLVVPSGADTSNLANPKYGEGTTGALFVKTTDSTLWFKVGGRWVQASGGSSGPGGGGITNISYRAGSVVDTLYYTDSGGDTDWYYVIQKQGLIAGGIVTYSGFDRTYYVTAAIYRIGDTFYSTSDTTITLAALASPDSSRSDVFVVNTSSQTTTVTGVESANPLVPQTDPATQVFLTHVTLTSSNPDAGVDTVVIYDENIEWTGSATGVTVNFNGATNVYRGSKTTDVSSINSGDIIVYTNGSAINRLSHAGVSFFIRLKQAMPNNNNITVSFWNGSTQVSSAVNIPINKTNTTSYQGLSLGMDQFTWSNNLFDRVRFTYSGSGISGLYLDFVYLVDGIVVVSPSTDYVQNIRRVGDDIEQQKGGVFTKVFDISDKGTVSSVGSGYGLLGGAITTTGTLRADTFAVSTRAWRDKLADSLGAVKLNKTDTATMLAGYVRSVYRKAGSDSVFVVKAGGATFAFKDSIGGGSGSGVTTVGTFSGSSQTNGASISGSTITFGPADGTNPGMISTGAQTIAGNKRFTSTILTSSGLVSGVERLRLYEDGATYMGVGISSARRVQFYGVNNFGFTWNGGSGLQTDGTNEWMKLTDAALTVSVPFNVNQLVANSATFSGSGVADKITLVTGYGFGINTSYLQNYVGAGGNFSWNTGGYQATVTTNQLMSLNATELATTVRVKTVPDMEIRGNVQSTSTQTFLQLIRPVSSGQYWPGVVDFNVLAYGSPSGFLPQTRLDIRLKADGSGTEAANVDVLTLRADQLVGVATTSPNSTLHASGSLAAAVRSITSGRTLDVTDHTILAGASGAAFNVTLPTAVGITGRIYNIKKTDSSANAVTVNTTSSQTIDGATTYSLATQYKYVTVQSDGANWVIIGNN